MKIIKLAAMVIIAFVSFLLSKKITDELVLFKSEWGGWIVNLLVLSPLYILVFSALAGVIGFGQVLLVSEHGIY